MSGNMMGTAMDGIRQIAHYRMAIAIMLPLLGGALALAASLLTPRGRAKGLITGAYMLLASVGGACLLFALIAAFSGEPSRVYIPLLVPGIVLAAVMGIFTPEIIQQYQQFEFRKLTAEIFRRS